MNKKKSIIIAVLVLVIGSFHINAQSIDDLRHEAEEERTAEEAYWGAISIMYRCILFDSINKDTYIPCFCYPLLDRVWVHTFISLDGNLRVNIFYDNDGKVGELFYTAIIKSYGAAKLVEDIDTTEPSIDMRLDNGNLTFISNDTDLYKFDILIW